MVEVNLNAIADDLVEIKVPLSVQQSVQLMSQNYEVAQEKINF